MVGSMADRSVLVDQSHLLISSWILTHRGRSLFGDLETPQAVAAIKLLESLLSLPSNLLGLLLLLCVPCTRAES